MSLLRSGYMETPASVLGGFFHSLFLESLALREAGCHDVRQPWREGNQLPCCEDTQAAYGEGHMVRSQQLHESELGRGTYVS